MEENRAIFKLRLDGGNLSLDFVNTVEGRYEGPLTDYLRHYLDLITWTHFANAIDSTQKEKLSQISRKNPEEATQIYEDSIQLREAMHEFVVSLINRDEIPPASMQLINQWLSRALSNLELTRLDSDFVLGWRTENFGLESVLWPIIRSFVDLITSVDLTRLKQCSNCGWAFVDNSKNKSRRWCSMEICGNRVKARRHANKIRA